MEYLKKFTKPVLVSLLLGAIIFTYTVKSQADDKYCDSLGGYCGGGGCNAAETFPQSCEILCNDGGGETSILSCDDASQH